MSYRSFAGQAQLTSESRSSTEYLMLTDNGLVKAYNKVLIASWYFNFKKRKANLNDRFQYNWLIAVIDIPVETSFLYHAAY